MGQIIYFVFLLAAFVAHTAQSDFCNQVDSETVECELRVLNPNIDLLNLTSPFSFSSLRLLCNEVILFETSISSSNTFEGLPSLSDLNIQGCKLGHMGSDTFAAIPHLRTLTLNTGHWKRVELSGRVIGRLKGLQRLNLSQNHLKELPPLPPSLNFLNLSHNVLHHLSLTGAPNLKALDLSSNLLSDLQIEGPKLEILDLSWNLLETLEFLSSALPLKELNGSCNLLTDASNLKDLPLLRVLDLRNNSLSNLVLEGLGHLQTLSLGENKLETVRLEGLLRLVILDLRENRLSTVPQGLAELFQLQVLDLSGNQLLNFANLHLSNLHSLNLGRNLVQSVGNLSLVSLHKLNLDYNNVSAMFNLSNCTSLQDLGLAGNGLKNVPPALRDLTLLKSLDLGENELETLSGKEFEGLGQLFGLRLVANKLTALPTDLCQFMPKMRILNVGANKLKNGGDLRSCLDLRVLRLDSNQLHSVPALNPQLLWLNISSNFLEELDFNRLVSLEWIDVSWNRIKALFGGDKQREYKLRVLDASHNSLTSISSWSPPESLEVLRLSNNRLEKVESDIFSNCGRLRRVDLVGNELESLSIRLPLLVPQPEFLIGGNPFLCDCAMEWLMRSSALRFSVLDLDSVMCKVTHSPQRIILPQMRPQDFLCPYESHCFALCHCCDFAACDCEMTCPDNCSCYHDDMWTTNLVHCQAGSHTAIPHNLPMDSTEVRLDGNVIRVLKPHGFIGRKNLKVLYLNGSKVEGISNKSFNGLVSLNSLHLNDNRLTRLLGYEFVGLTRLVSLFLQDNRLVSISNVTFLPLKALEVLRLDGNFIVVYNVWQLSLNPYLVEIGLGRNPWLCDCTLLQNLYGWLSENSKKVLDFSAVHCVYNESGAMTKGPHLIDYNMTCVETDQFLFQIPRPIWLGLAGAILLIFFAFLSLLFYYILVKRRFIPFYDAYFVYAEGDEDLVVKGVAENLRETYRLCLHHTDIDLSRDPVKAVWETLDNSKSLVIFLSHSFLSDPLLRSLFKGGKGRRRIIVLLEDALDVPKRRDERWISFGQKGFWAHLKDALPDPHYNASTTTTNSSKSISPLPDERRVRREEEEEEHVYSTIRLSPTSSHPILFPHKGNSHTYLV